ncbi:hypothetical protein CVT26_013035 [Gymnopilus dilepis]|uniref:Uncharacterized protein n=1 Tax=Gymnopilus dilepis TaxID=231916 RepID=A0A409Y4A2_9AGAR|nr:hypothetical protein CVT26_013035 [Gymnopilus dilepis]
MIFPFTFNFSVPGILNPFSKVPSPLSPPVTAGLGSAGEQGNNKRSRIQQSPTYDSCQSSTPNFSSQGPLGYRDNIPAPAYPSSIPSDTRYRRISRADLPKIERRPSPSPSTSASASSSLRALPLSRKRGWEPAFGAESIQSLSPPTGKGKTDSTTSLTLLSSSGYLDTPAKYRDMVEDVTMRDNAYNPGDQQEDEDDAPPMKKRRGLAGSIVSTAVSAALIGTAVGLTVYRLWRDRGKEPQGKLTHPASSSSHIDGASTPGSDSDHQVPPPPYDPGAWKPPIQDAQQPILALTPSTPISTPRKNRWTKRPVGGGHHSASGSTRRARPRHGGVGASGSGVGSSPRVRPEFDFGREGRSVGLGLGVDMDADEGRAQDEVEDKMDWIGDKLSMLIEQGRRALQSEVVVMSEVKEDEVDDGRGDWEEDNNGADDSASLRSRKSRSRAGSVRKSRPKNIVPPSPHHFTSQPHHPGSISASPRMSTFPSGLTSSSTAYSTPSTSYSPAMASGGFAPSSSFSSYSVKVANGHGHVRGLSHESALPSSSSSSGFGAGREEPEMFESPELRESMERARARALARRAGGGPV